VFQLCTGGSVTDLVQGLKRRAESLTEDQIAYIIRETVQVRYIAVVLQLNAEASSQKRKADVSRPTVYGSCLCMDGHVTDGRTG
jgi:hypothetical protein